MAYSSWKITHTPSGGSPTDITELHDPSVTVSLGDGRDDFSFKITNAFDQYDNTFAANDNVVIYRDVDTSVVTTQLLNGKISDVTEVGEPKSSVLRIKGENYSDVVMSAIVFFDGQGLATDAAVDQLVASLNLLNANLQIGQASSNPNVKYSDGSSFPTVKKRFFYRQAKDTLNMLSEDEYTKDGRYFWYINKDNELVWDKRQAANTYEFDSDTDVYYSIKVSKNTSKVKNYFIMKGGSDAKGNPIQRPVFDVVSMNKNGTHYQIVVDETKYAENLLSQDLADNQVDDMVDATYPLANDPPWVSNVDSFDGEVTNFNEYNTLLKAEAVRNLKRMGNDLLVIHKDGRYEVTIEFPPGKTWVLGEVVEVTTDSIGTKIMRVEQITYTSDSDIFTLREDKGTL